MQICKEKLPFVLVFLLYAVAVVQARRVIRAAPGVETTGRYIVVLTNETSHDKFETIADEVRNVSLNSDIFEKVEGPFAKIVTAELSEDGAHKVKDFDNVEFVEEETYAEGTISWALDRIDQVSSTLNGKFEPYGDGEGVDIYILDSGINYDHCEFEGYRANYSGRDPIDATYNGNQQGRDCHGHGTHVASLACGKNSGVAKKATCYSVRVLGCNNRAPWSAIIDGLNHAATKIMSSNPRRPSIISMSLGGGYTSSVDTVLKNVLNKSIPIVAAAGNDEGDACLKTPASTPGVITVGGTAKGDDVYYYTNGGSCVDILAPGDIIQGADYTCNQCSCIKTLSGTSMSTPIVSGVIAIHLQKQPNLTPAEITQKLIQESLKNKLNYRYLPVKLRLTTANRLLYVNSTQSCDPTTYTITNTMTSTSTVTSVSTTTATPPTVTSTVTTTSISATTLTSTITTTSVSVSTTTSIITSSVGFTVTITPTPTLEGMCCQTLRNFEDLEKNMIDNIGSIVKGGINYIADLLQNNASLAPPTTPSTLPPITTSPLSPSPTQPTEPPPNNTITSCSSLLQYSSATSGEYLIGNKSVYCELEKEIKGNKGFMRVAYLNMSVPGTKCPGNLTLRQDGSLKTCQRGQNNPGCSSAFFSTCGIPYSKICGRVRGYQWSSPNAFYWFQRHPLFTIDDLYVDGVVLTYKNNSKRQHIWTFAGALDPIERYVNFACPCTNNDSLISFSMPSFVGKDYFCETGAKDTYLYNKFYTDDPLWDGQGCTEKDICCDRGQWFCKDVPKTNSDIELRLCGNEHRSNEDTPLEIIELYVQ